MSHKFGSMQESEEVFLIRAADLQVVLDACDWIGDEALRSPRRKKLRELAAKTRGVLGAMRSPGLGRITVLALSVDGLQRQINDISETLDSVEGDVSDTREHAIAAARRG